MGFGGSYRVCGKCGNEYHASRPVCPSCGAMPFDRSRAFAVAGPRLFLWIASIYFLVLAAYGIALPDALYEKYSGVFFFMPRAASIAVGLAGGALFTILSIRDFLKRRSKKRKA